MALQHNEHMSISPKRLQKHGELDLAAKGFAERYLEAIQDKDEFMRNHYLDELAHTILLELEQSKNAPSKKDGLRPAELQSRLHDIVVASAQGKAVDWSEVERYLSEDCELTILKRYPSVARQYEKEEL